MQPVVSSETSDSGYPTIKRVEFYDEKWVNEKSRKKIPACNPIFKKQFDGASPIPQNNQIGK
jgi:hypothetical protein